MCDQPKYPPEGEQNSHSNLSQAIITSPPGVFYCFDRLGQFAGWNQNLELAACYSGPEITKLHPLDLFVDKDKPLIQNHIQKVFTEGSAEAEAHLLAKDGTTSLYSLTSLRATIEGQTFLVGVGIDVSDRARAEANQRLLSMAVNAADDSIMITDRDGIIQWVNPSFTRVTGYQAEEALGRTPRILKSGVQDAAFYEHFWKTVLAGTAVQGELVNRRKDGSLYHERESITPVLNEGQVTHFIAIKRDISESYRREQESQLLLRLSKLLAEAENFDTGLAEALRMVCECMDWDYGEAWLPSRDEPELELWPRGYSRLECGEKFRTSSQQIQFVSGQGFPARVLAGKRPIWLPDVRQDPDFLRKSLALEAGFRAALGVPVLAGQTVVVVLVFFLRQVSQLDDRLVDVVAAVAGTLGLALQRKQAEEKVAASEEKFRTLIEHASDLISIIDGQGKLHFQGPSSQRLLGHSAESMASCSIYEWIHPEDRPRVENAVRRLLNEPDLPQTIEYRIRKASGEWAILESIARGILFEPVPDCILLNSRDVTANRRLEDQLRQSQKMDAIGQVASGVAHDFNNILSAILMQAEWTSSTECLSAEAAAGLQDIRDAAKRATDLTRQLLLFSRGHAMQLQDLDLNDTVSNLSKLLQRLLGKEVNLQLDLCPGPLRTRSDHGMLGQVILNLAINARDAMPQGGLLRIQTVSKTVMPDDETQSDDVSPGQYVGFQVCDTGSGIPVDILPHIFEPFFSTKENNKGTGLGLATVFKIVRQHHGWTQVDSQPGHTEFQVFIPALAP